MELGVDPVAFSVGGLLASLAGSRALAWHWSPAATLGTAATVGIAATVLAATVLAAPALLPSPTARSPPR